jgi:CHASE3 domain sensor protein
MANLEKKENKTIGQKLSLAFTIFCVIFLIARFTGLLDPVIEFFKG